MKKQKEQFDGILCKEERKEQVDCILCMEEYEDGTHKPYLCYAPSSLSIKEGDIVTIELPALALLCAYDEKLKRNYVAESAYDGTEIKSGLKVIRRGGTIPVNEDVYSILEPFGRILYKEETK